MTMFKGKSAQDIVEPETSNTETNLQTQNAVPQTEVFGSSLKIQLDNPANVFKVNTPVTLTVYGTATKPIVGFDAVISFNEKAAEYNSASSINDNFQVWPKEELGKVYITAGKKLSVTGAVEIKDSPLLSVVFTPLQTGEVEFNLDFTKGDTTDSSLIDTETQDILEQVSGIKINVQ